MKPNYLFNYMSLLLIKILLLASLSSCKKNNGNIPSPHNQDSIKQPRVIASGNKLVTSDGKPFKVWGFNYGAGSEEGLMDDNWNNESAWVNFDSDFKEMKDLGANMIRIHLQYNKFMNSPTQPNAQAFKNLKRMVKLAEKHNLYLLITGLGAYRKSDQPVWYNNLNDAERWATQAIFWKNVAATAPKSPAILGYDLMNEPAAGVDSTNGWLPGNGFGGFYYVQNIALHLNGKPWAEIMRNWIITMTAAIRKADTQNMITVGFLSFHAFAEFSADLDLMTTHLYPKTGNFEPDNLSIQKFQSSKPLVITETYPLNAGANDLQTFIEYNNPYVSGWAWHYFGKTIEDYTPPKDMPDALRKAALEKFKEMSATQK